MSDICLDNRFELIEKYKTMLMDATNIAQCPDEMAVIDDILFRFWQMGWLDKLERKVIMTPHGRLIDADELEHLRWSYKDAYYFIDNAPTVIESEE